MLGVVLGAAVRRRDDDVTLPVVSVGCDISQLFSKFVPGAGLVCSGAWLRAFTQQPGGW
jgi:hypothetical protein